VNQNLPLYGIVTTYGNIPIANSPIYRKEILVPHGKRHHKPEFDHIEELKFFPDVLSVDELELLYVTMESHTCQFPNLVKDRADKNYMAIGDWGAYLHNILEELNTKKHTDLPFAKADWNELLQSIFPDVDMEIIAAKTPGT